MTKKITALPKAGNYDMENLATLNVRELWRDEARDFTPWLANKECLTLLASVLGIEIKEKPKTETSVAYSNRRCDIEALVKGDSENHKVLDARGSCRGHNGRGALGSLRPYGFTSFRQPDAYGAGESVATAAERSV